MSEVKLAGDTSRWIKHYHGGVNIRIILDSAEQGSPPAGAKIIAEGSNERVTWRPLESSDLKDAIDEAKNYANQWVDQGMPSSGVYRPIDLGQ